MQGNSNSKAAHRKTQSSLDIQASKSLTNTCSIMVYIRVRPVLSAEYQKEVAVSANKENNTVVVNTRTNIIQTKFDRVFDSNTTQLQFFEEIKVLIPQVFKGYNSTIFAYGQTGSGKTYSMFGSDWENIFSMSSQRKIKQKTYIEDIGNDKQYSGIIPRTIFKIFQDTEAPGNASKKFSIYCSFLQIYNEKIFDLLQDKKVAQPLQIRENQYDGIYVEGLTEYCVSSFDECLRLMQRGENNRNIRQTSQNVKSSRSHTIFQIMLESTMADEKGRLQKSKLNLCDLAGSEKLRKQDEIEIAHLQELKGINLSLTTLGKVIHNLSTGSKIPIPYRESKLTRLLQDSLGGNTQTCLIATLSPTVECVEESLSTIKFAERASHIITQIKPNQIAATDDQLVKKLKKEIEYLREILMMRRQGISAIGEVHNKLLILKQENDRLRQSQVSIQEVETLLQENRKMKQELQKLKITTSHDASHLVDVDRVHSQELDSKGFHEVMTLKTPFVSNLVSPSNLATPHALDNFDQFSVDRMPKSTAHSRILHSTQPFDLDIKTTPEKSERISAFPPSRESLLSNLKSIPSSHTSDLIYTGRLIAGSKLNSPRSDIKLPQISKTELKIRIKGKGTSGTHVKGYIERSVDEQKRLEDQRTAQLKALDRINDLEKLRKSHQDKLQKELELLTTEKEFIPSSMPSSPMKKSNFKPQLLNSAFNPYNARDAIEKKYSQKNKSGHMRNQSIKVSTYNEKIKRIEQNLLK